MATGNSDSVQNIRKRGTYNQYLSNPSLKIPRTTKWWNRRNFVKCQMETNNVVVTTDAPSDTRYLFEEQPLSTHSDPDSDQSCFSDESYDSSSATPVCDLTTTAEPRDFENEAYDEVSCSVDPAILYSKVPLSETLNADSDHDQAASDDSDYFDELEKTDGEEKRDGIAKEDDFNINGDGELYVGAPITLGISMLLVCGTICQDLH